MIITDHYYHICILTTAMNPYLFTLNNYHLVLRHYILSVNLVLITLYDIIVAIHHHEPSTSINHSQPFLTN